NSFELVPPDVFQFIPVGVHDGHALLEANTNILLQFIYFKRVSRKIAHAVTPCQSVANKVVNQRQAQVAWLEIEIHYANQRVGSRFLNERMPDTVNHKVLPTKLAEQTKFAQ